MLIMALLFLLALPLPGHAGLYLNSLESGCDGSDPSVVFCDDFNNSVWAQTDANCYQHTAGSNNPAQVSGCLSAGGANLYANNKGWFATIYVGGDPACTIVANTSGCTFQGASSVIGSDTWYAHCGGSGPIANAPQGTSCYGRSGISYAYASPINSMLFPISHNLGPTSDTRYTNAVVRWLMYFSDGVGSASTAFTWTDTKILSPMNSFNNNGIIQMGHLGCNKGAGGTTTTCQPVWCPSDGSACLDQQTPLAMGRGKWYHLVFQMIPNSSSGSSDCTIKLWIDDGGSTGTFTGSPTLRMSYTNAKCWRTTECPNCGTTPGVGAWDFELSYQNAPGWSVGQEAYFALFKSVDGSVGTVPIAFPSGGGGGSTGTTQRGGSRMRVERPAVLVSDEGR